MNTTSKDAHSKSISTSPQSYRRYFILPLVGLIAAVFLSILYHYERRLSPSFFGQPINPAKVAYDFQLTNQDGVQVRLSQWKGKVVIFSFGFTHCPNVCPTTLMNLADVFRALPAPDRDRVRIAFISVDPRRDSPEQLKEYLSYFDPAFVGLVGPKDEIDRATGAFGASYAFVHKPGDPSDDYNVMHSANIYLINPKGEWELIYDAQKLEQPEKVAVDIERVGHG
jgi:protein SCO1/2